MTESSIVDEIHAWAKETFPEQSNPRLARHLVEETEELESAIADDDTYAIAENIADCLILLSELMCRLEETAEQHGVNIVAAVRAKHEINTGRRWADSGRGYDRHVAEEILA